MFLKSRDNTMSLVGTILHRVFTMSIALSVASLSRATNTRSYPLIISMYLSNRFVPNKATPVEIFETEQAEAQSSTTMQVLLSPHMKGFLLFPYRYHFGLRPSIALPTASTTLLPSLTIKTTRFLLKS